MSVPFHVIIPAREGSTRLPGKCLMDLNGLSVIERVYRQACLAEPQSITIATDSVTIFNHAQGFGSDVVMTANTHQSGTDRLAEAALTVGFDADALIVNVQGDEPLMPPPLIRQVAHVLAHTKAPMATLCWPVERLSEALDPNVVKVVRDAEDNALYFSRSLIPANRDNPTQYHNTFRHIGLYAYRAAFLQQFVQWPVCELESMEALEQLRVLWAGYRIQVPVAMVPPQQDINTLADLERARATSSG